MKYILPALLIFMLAAAAYAGGPQEVKFSGTVKKIYAIGGETPGWALALDFETAVAGKVFKQIEMDPGETNMEQYKGQSVEVTGTLKEKTGVERGKYTVLQVKTIKPIQ
jgi:hypothetical protein